MPKCGWPVTWARPGSRFPPDIDKVYSVGRFFMRLYFILAIERRSR
jgi:hypothetical protein